MRSLLITGALFAALAAQTPMPRNIAVSRSFGNPGQVGLFIASSDGSDETSAALFEGFRLRSGMGSRWIIHRLYFRSRWIGGSFSR